MRDDDIDDSTAPLMEHLAELRKRLINCLLAFSVAMIAAFAVAGPIFNFLAAPLAELLVEHGQKPELIYTGLQQGFFTQVRISVSSADACIALRAESHASSMSAPE